MAPAKARAASFRFETLAVVLQALSFDAVASPGVQELPPILLVFRFECVGVLFYCLLHDQRLDDLVAVVVITAHAAAVSST